MNQRGKTFRGGSGRGGELEGVDEAGTGRGGGGGWGLEWRDAGAKTRVSAVREVTFLT